MEKWIKKRVTDIKPGRLFTLKSFDCYHPKLDVNFDFSMIETNDWINVIPLTVDSKFVMVKQHRLGTDNITIETPGGVVETGEDIHETAMRELIEETGYKPENLHFLCRLATNPAIMNNYINFYFADNCRKIDDQNLDHIEDIEVELFTQDEIINLIREGGIEHSIVVTALCLYFMSDYNKTSVKL